MSYHKKQTTYLFLTILEESTFDSSILENDTYS